MSKTEFAETPPINWVNMLLFTITPTLAVTIVPLYGFFYGYDVFEWSIFLLYMGFCGISITAGYHRLWSHKTYQAHPCIRLIFAIGGACALQNDVFNWASDHRRHHQHVDDNEHDPYSAGRGFWFSHIGWILRDYASSPDDFSNIQDLQRDPILQWQHKNYLTLVLITNVLIPALIGFLHGDIVASLLLVGLLRLVLSQHATYLINSIAHIWGRQPYSDKSSARDNSIIALVTYGEGYHNYHHTFQWDYRNGISWWHYDPTKWLIKSLSLCGLATGLKKVTAERIEAAKVKMQYQLVTQSSKNYKLSAHFQTKLEKEYQQLLLVLNEWAERRKAWLDCKAPNMTGRIHKMDRHRLKTRYKEAKRNLKARKREWELMLRNLPRIELAR
jgi:stearoyl-CoA desaturase (delta-9 desaturase)|tara:strand:+ start:692 stop:1852 length:1161 start_codon:yes stop_codon:yes gene_type:complete